MSYKVYVGNIPYSLTEEGLKELFESCGTVLSVSIPLDKLSDRPKGFGFVEMNSKEDIGHAITNLDAAIVGGRPIVVSEAVEKDPPKHASKLNNGPCIICNTHAPLFGFNDNTGVCAPCVLSLYSTVKFFDNKEHNNSLKKIKPRLPY